MLQNLKKFKTWASNFSRKLCQRGANLWPFGVFKKYAATHFLHYVSIFEAVLPVLMPCHHQLRLLWWNWVQYSLCISTLIGKIKFEITFFRKTKFGVLFLDKTWICKKILQILLWNILYLVRLFSKSSPCSEFAISSFVIGSSYIVFNFISRQQ